MQLQQMLNQISNKNAPENVQGWERAASAVTGLMMVKRGLRGRGLTSLLLLATGGMAVMRAVNGRCEIKRRMQESQNTGSQGSNKERYSHMPMDSEVHSPDFKSSSTSMPDSTKMGNEASAPLGAAAASTTGSTGASSTPGTPLTSGSAGSRSGSSASSSTSGSAGTASTAGASGKSGGSNTPGASGNR